MILLIDGDLICYKFGLIYEKEVVFGNIINITANAGDACRAVKIYLNKLMKKLKGTDCIICFSDINNWRFKVYPLYKSHRKNFRKPILLNIIKDFLVDNYKCHEKKNLEADDVLGILQTSNLLKKETIIVSEDKDFKSVPGKTYNPKKNILLEITKEEADYNHFYQALVGDVADGYPGCPGIGDKKAKKILDKKGNMWNNIIEAFKSQGLSEEEALVQARVSRILRAEDYDFDKQEPILWNP